MPHIDLTHTFTPTMPVYPGDPVPELKQISFLDRHGYNDFQVTTGMHVGTHMDAPLHMLKDGKRLSEYPPEYFFGTGHLIDARGKAIDATLLSERTIAKGDIVFIFTGFSEKYGSTEYYETYPEVTQEFAAKMVELGVHIIGMDSPSPDREPFSVHKLLLGNDILIIENLTNLEQLPGVETFSVVALPAKFEAEAAPVRVVAHW